MACAEAGSTEAMETHVLQSADDGEALAPPPCATLVLCYHRVRPQVADDPYGLTITCDRFEEQLDALASWGRFMAPAELFEPSAPVSDRPRILVTFDDGYRDNLEHAFPILSRRGIPAAWFVVTGAVERSAPFWWETVALAHRRGHDVPLGDPEGWRFLPAALRARRLSGVEARLSHADIEQIASMCPTWPTLVADARRFGIVLGAHTSTHTSLGRLATADIEREVGDSLDALTRWTGRTPTLFAYPHGSPDDVSIAAIDGLRRAGLLFAFTTEPRAMTAIPRPGSRAALTAPRIVVGDEGAHDLLARLSGLVEQAAATHGVGPERLAGAGRSTVAVLSGISAHNLGDDAMLVATVRDLLTLRPGLEVRVLAEEPAACRGIEAELGVPVLRSPHDYVQRVIAARPEGCDPVDAVRRAAHAVSVRHAVSPGSAATGVALADDEAEGLRWLLEADGVIDCGGANLDSHWLDYFYEKCFDYLVAARPLVVTGQGIGAFGRAEDRDLLREALGRVDCLTVREQLSAQHAREVGFGGYVTVAGDDALTLEPSSAARVDEVLATVGLGQGEAFAVFQFRETLDYQGAMVVERFASVVDELGDATGLPVVGLPMHFGGCDERTHLAAISARMRRPGALRIIPAELGARDALGVMARATVACGISYHSAVFSLLSGVPFIGIYKGGHYTQKFDGLSQLYEVADLAVPLDGVGPGTIARAVAARLAGAVPLRARLAARNAALLDAVRRPRRALVEAVERAGEGPAAVGGGRAAVVPVQWGSLRRLDPVSADWGFDRGQPLDRYYIDHFVAGHRADIRGAVCELLNREYTERFGDTRVTSSDVLDIDGTNATATIVDDLARPVVLPRDRFDCFILTQTLPYIFDCAGALAHAYAATRPGGVLLVTVPSIIRYHREPEDHWRFTVDSMQRLVAEQCPGARATVGAHGNLLSAVGFLYGLASRELSAFELEHADARFPLVITARIVKGHAS